MISRLPFATRGRRLLPWALLPVAAVFLVPLTVRPKAALALIGAAVIASTASISVAVPLGLAGFAAPIVAIVGHDPFPNHAVPLSLSRGSPPSSSG